jgi:sugar phosphate isomerase/epimerase
MTVRFGISTHLFLGERLACEHLAAIAAHGFETVEVFCHRSHFDYHDARAVSALGTWLRETGLVLNSLHAPIAAAFANGKWSDAYSTAWSDEPRRAAALQETAAALRVAEGVRFGSLVVHLGTPAGHALPGDNSRDAARRTIDALAPTASAAGVGLALELIPNPLSAAAALVHFIEDVLEVPGAGICLDIGHAHLMGDAVEAIETCSGHIITTHLHDNRKKSDDHLIPYSGTIDWPSALVAFQKVGYDGAWMFELAVSREPQAMLAAAAKARGRFEELLTIGSEWGEEGG